MISVQLIGAPTCRRYQKMREILLAEATALDAAIDLEEINDTLRLMQFNPLSLPQLHMNGVLVAQGNPPQAEHVRRLLQDALSHT